MYFENEKLDLINVDKEFEITLRGMLAQDESRNTTENIQWGFQRKFEKGDIFTKYKNFMGYACVGGEIFIVQKTFTEDFMTGKKVQNIGQRSRYYVRDSHPAIVSTEIYDKVQEEMARRVRLVHKEDGTVEASTSKYNGKYLLWNLLVCGNCGASYRRRTEQGKVVWRCATRVEKGKAACMDSPTLNEEWVQNVLGKMVCENGIYDEEIIRNNVEEILIFKEHLEICCRDETAAFREYCLQIEDGGIKSSIIVT